MACRFGLSWLRRYGFGLRKPGLGVMNPETPKPLNYGLMEYTLNHIRDPIII